jgi:hypothetical protein
MSTDNFVFICQTDESKPVKQEDNSKVILPPLVFPGWHITRSFRVDTRCTKRRWNKEELLAPRHSITIEEHDIQHNSTQYLVHYFQCPFYCSAECRVCCIIMVSVVAQSKSYSRELLLKGMAQYSWPSCTNLFRSATLDIANMLYFSKKKTSYLFEEVNCTETSLLVSVPCLF